MIARQPDYDPSDLRPSTIESLFYRQIRGITRRSTAEKMRTFDVQFSDSWI